MRRGFSSSPEPATWAAIKRRINPQATNFLIGTPYIFGFKTAFYQNPAEQDKAERN
jgi:hypothetical protein